MDGQEEVVMIIFSEIWKLFVQEMATKGVMYAVFLQDFIIMQ